MEKKLKSAHSCCVVLCKPLPKGSQFGRFIWALIEISLATNWQHCKKMLVRVKYLIFGTKMSQSITDNGCVPFPTIASNLLAFSSKMADVAATSTDIRSVTLLTTYNTRSVHAVTHRAQQNLRDFTAIRPCFQQFAVDNMDDNVSRSNITTTSNNLLARGTLVTLHFSKLLANCWKRNRANVDTMSKA